MSEKVYRLVFQGEILPGQDVEQVKKNLAKTLKRSERTIAPLFSGEKVVLMKQTNAETAKSLENLFREAGAILRVEDLRMESPSLASQSSHSQSVMSQMDPYHQERKDRAPVILFVTALVILLAFGGYLAWKQIRPGHLGKGTNKSISRMHFPWSKKRHAVPYKPSRTSRTRLTSVDYQLLRRLHKEGLECVRKDEYEKAEPLYRKRLEVIRKKVGGENSLVLSSAMNDLAFTIREQQRYDEAEKLYQGAIELCEKTGKDNDLAVAVASEGLAKIYLKQEKLDKIDPLYLRAINIWDKIRGKDNANTLSIKLRRADLLEKLGRKEEAEQLRKQARETWNKLRQTYNRKSSKSR